MWIEVGGGKSPVDFQTTLHIQDKDMETDEQTCKRQSNKEENLIISWTKSCATNQTYPRLPLLNEKFGPLTQRSPWGRVFFQTIDAVRGGTATEACLTPDVPKSGNWAG